MMESLFNWAAAAILLGIAWIGVGFVSRLIVWLFCIGYGC